MRVVLSLIVVALLCVPAVAADEARIKAFCDADWAHDADMHEYCIELQVEASDILDGVKAEHPEGSDGARIIAACEAEWHPDYEVQVTCSTESLAAAEFVDSYNPAGVSAEFLASIKGHCNDEWPDDHIMIKACVEKLAFPR